MIYIFRVRLTSHKSFTSCSYYTPLRLLSLAKLSVNGAIAQIPLHYSLLSERIYNIFRWGAPNYQNLSNNMRKSIVKYAIFGYAFSLKTKRERTTGSALKPPIHLVFKRHVYFEPLMAHQRKKGSLLAVFFLS